MTLFRTISRVAAALAAASLVIAPVAQADRGGRGDHRGGWDRRGDDYHDRRGRHDDHYDRRGRSHHYDRRHDHHYKHYYKPRKHYHHHDYRPVVVYPRSYYPRSSVTVSYGYSYGPYYYSGYTPRYSVGGYYTYGPRSTVYINDYNSYGLYAPPHGYHWVRDHDRGDAILASVATGAIIGLVVGALVAD